MHSYPCTIHPSDYTAGRAVFVRYNKTAQDSNEKRCIRTSVFSFSSQNQTMKFFKIASLFLLLATIGVLATPTDDAGVDRAVVSCNYQKKGI